MKIKRVLSLIIAMALVIMCSGCSLNFFSVESLLAPPLQSGKNGEVQTAFNSLMKDKQFQLKTPVSGEFQSSFVLFDINGDGTDESLVFYSDSSVESSVHMALLEYHDENWIISSDVKGAGSGIFDVAFSDLDSDGIYEVFVSWSLFDNKTTKIISVYSPVADSRGLYTFETLGNEYCNAKYFTDFNGDLRNDLVVIYLDDTANVPKSYLRSFSLSEKGEFVKYSELLLDAAIASVSDIKSDTIKAGHESYTRLFIDCYKSSRMIFTELVYWNVAEACPVRAIKDPAVSTARNLNVQCQDIDSDGYIEVPVITKMYGDEKHLSVTDSDEVYTFTLLNWLNQVGDVGGNIVKTLYNPLDSYLFRFPWDGNVSVRYDSERNALLYCLWNEESGTYGEELFSVAYRESLDEEVYGEVLYESRNGRYYYEITEQGESFGITDSDVISSFIKNN